MHLIGFVQTFEIRMLIKFDTKTKNNDSMYLGSVQNIVFVRN